MTSQQNFMPPLLLGLGTASLLFHSAAADPLRDLAAQIFGPLPSVACDSDPALAALGQALFTDPHLSATGGDSCAGCHDVTVGGADGKETALGHDWQTAHRNTSTVLNASLNESWACDLLETADRPAMSGLRQTGADKALDLLRADPDCAASFAAAFPGAGDPVSLDQLVGAIDAYLATLLTPLPSTSGLHGTMPPWPPTRRSECSFSSTAGARSAITG